MTVPSLEVFDGHDNARRQAPPVWVFSGLSAGLDARVVELWMATRFRARMARVRQRRKWRGISWWERQVGALGFTCILLAVTRMR